MKKIIVLLLIALPIVSVAKKHKFVNTGYLFYVSTQKGSKPIKTEDIGRIQLLFNKYSGQEGYDVKIPLKRANVLQVIEGNKIIYIERKKINNKGKYRKLRNGEIFVY